LWKIRILLLPFGVPEGGATWFPAEFGERVADAAAVAAIAAAVARLAPDMFKKNAGAAATLLLLGLLYEFSSDTNAHGSPLLEGTPPNITDASKSKPSGRTRKFRLL
jgi:hypothetical protein